MKVAIPIAMSMYGTKVVSRKLVPMIPGVSYLGKHAAPIGAGLMLIGASFVTKKVTVLRKHRQNILVGVGLNLLDVVLSAYVPDEIKAGLGFGVKAKPGKASASEQSAMGEYVQMGEYIDVSGYESEMGEYIDIGAEEELGVYEELGEENIGTGIGTQNAAMLRAVPSQAMVAPIPTRSFVKQVSGVGAGYDSMANLYTGSFAGGLK